MSEKKSKRDLFVEEYLVDLNATQAAIRAGYSERSAEVTGHRLLRDAKVAAAIAEAQKARSERTEITADWVLKNLKTVAERCMQAEPVLDRDGKETGEFTFNASGANRSLELIGKHLKMFTDRTEIDASDPLKELFNQICGRAIRPKENG